MIYDKDKLNEIFVIPIGLKVVARLDGQELFGSEKLNLAFVKAISKSRIKDSADKINSLVEKGLIVPCFLNKSLLRFFVRKIFAPKASRSVVAFYEPIKNKKVYVLIDNNVNFISYVSNQQLSLVVVHELMHMYADRKPGAFLSTFKSDLVRYYTNVWKTIFSLDMKKVDSKKVEGIVQFLFKKLERKQKEVSTSDLVEYFKLLNAAFSDSTTLSKEEFNRQSRDYIVVLKLFLTDFSAFFAVVRKFTNIMGPLYVAYKQVFAIKNLNTLAIQELLYPSEVIAIVSEYGFKSKVVKAIKQL